MNQIILASHGGLAAGARDTLSMVLGDVSNVHVVTLARDDKEPIAAEVERLVTTFDEGDAVYVCTDMLGSSVNNSVVELMNNGAKITVISGMNMPLVLSLAVAWGPLSAEELRAIVREARAGLVNCGEPEEPASPAPAKKRAVAGKGGKANIVLARLDYRLLHGQVVFSWVNSVAAQRIIVVDNEAANDNIKKGALKLAKPAGVYLNVYTVEKALSKMDRLNTLGENVMFVFGNVHEMLEFLTAYKLPEVNLGAAANHDGAEPVGGKDSSVFFDAAEKADAQKILDLGVRVYEQQTPTQPRTDITAF
ncbi:PTS mannose/fructose/sorbose transporter subunit IIAB [Collinsella stercoris]|uniref:PTS mannose/fructose/sorbose transporter subunit IIAB n=1 Tax=Collinsella stercoris TaxID=147206 RepID=UPI003AF16D84